MRIYLRSSIITIEKVQKDLAHAHFSSREYRHKNISPFQVGTTGRDAVLGTPPHLEGSS